MRNACVQYSRLRQNLLLSHKLFHSFAIAGDFKNKRVQGLERGDSLYFLLPGVNSLPCFPVGWGLQGLQPIRYFCFPQWMSGLYLLYCLGNSSIFSSLSCLVFTYYGMLQWPLIVNLPLWLSFKTIEPVCTSTAADVTQKCRSSILQAGMYLASELCGASLDLSGVILLLCKKHLFFPHNSTQLTHWMFIFGK